MTSSLPLGWRLFIVKRNTQVVSSLLGVSENAQLIILREHKSINNR